MTVPFCQILLRRPWEMTDADVIRLRESQGKYSLTSMAERRCSVPGVWREVLGVYRDRDSLEAEFGQRRRDDPASVPELHTELAGIASRAFEDSESSVLIRVLLHELSDPGMITDLFITLNRVDLVEVQSLPAPGRTWPAPAPQAVP
jgi:hypothetical protein